MATAEFSKFAGILSAALSQHQVTFIQARRGDSRPNDQAELGEGSGRLHIYREVCAGDKENNRMGKTRDLLKKIRDTKGTFHPKMGSIKDRNGRDLLRRY